MSQLPRLIRLVLSSFTVRTVVGVEGDVQPALPLAVERGKLGHAVRVCISPNFVAWAKSVGLDPVPMGVEKRMPSGKSGAMPTLTRRSSSAARIELEAEYAGAGGSQAWSNGP